MEFLHDTPHCGVARIYKIAWGGRQPASGQGVLTIFSSLRILLRRVLDGSLIVVSSSSDALLEKGEDRSEKDAHRILVHAWDFRRYLMSMCFTNEVGDSVLPSSNSPDGLFELAV